MSYAHTFINTKEVLSLASQKVARKLSKKESKKQSDLNLFSIAYS